MDHLTSFPLFEKFLLFCAVATAVALISHRFQLRPVILFFISGILIGPFGLGALSAGAGSLSLFTISDTAAVVQIAELGVVFLLFSIGLELSPKRLWAMHRLILGLGVGEIIVAGLVISAIAVYWQHAPFAALAIGFAFSLSSTAIVMPAILASGEFAQHHGRGIFAVLLAQDIAVAPILLVITAAAAAFGSGEPITLESAAWNVARAGGMIAAIVVFGFFFTRVVFETLAGPHHREMFLAFSLLIVAGSAAATDAVGISPALGAFIAGLILAETEFRTQLDIELEPLKGLLLGLFFFGVGLMIDLVSLLPIIHLVLLGVGGLFVIKGVLIFAIARLHRFTWSQAFLVAGALAGAGEFVFVILGVARVEGVLAGDVFQYMSSVAGISMILTPPAMAASARIARRFSQPDEIDAPIVTGQTDYSGHVLIVGFGRVGRTIAHFLRTFDVDYIAIDKKPANAAKYHKLGYPVFVGDASRPEMLARLGAENANAFVVTVDNHDAAEQVVRALKRCKPGALIVSRSQDPPGIHRLIEAGADKVIPDTVESSLQLATLVCESLDIPREALQTIVDELRYENYKGLE